jgi:hypothetical protein
VAASGDSGGPSQWPASSSNVVSVGGTDLPLDPAGDYPVNPLTGQTEETAWAGSSGGITSEPKPAYQNGVVVQNGGLAITYLVRTTPDVGYNAGDGVAVYDSFANATAPWVSLIGTSAGAPQWAALIALADQGRAQEGLGSLDGPSQTLPLLYHLPSSAFHDITSGSNANSSAAPGYDLVTGLGSPVANQVVAGLCQLQYQLRPDHTLWQITASGPVEIADGILAFSNPGDFSLMFLETNGDVVQDSPLWQRVVARNVLAGAVDDQGNPVNLQNASQFGVDNAGNVFALTPDGRLWRILDAGQSGAPVATVVRYGGQSFSIDRADTVFALSQDGHLDRGVNLDAPGAGSWTGIAANVEAYDVDKADTVFILQNGTVSRGLNFDTPGAESWTVIGYGMQSFTVDNADTVFNFGEEGTV